MNLSEIGKIIKQRRQFLRLKQEDLEELSKVNKKTIQQVETGNGNPSFETLDKLANVLGMEVSINVKNLNNG